MLAPPHSVTGFCFKLKMFVEITGVPYGARKNIKVQKLKEETKFFNKEKMKALIVL